ncbi:hypothetical protein SuNHUV7_20600 (plasmid) [Pseudoseohaeicola sp. NH-UV-7]|uniref:DUF938 domain-containing protein n=1 Tax=unclassified Sulfitobacter TaxID=196795 RepID=UPI000E0CB0C2|nr:DUF938 domain-containing protein [Sulfitobacter sp. JL08]AXI55980.1 methyltransferase [Sulfitobacter sp. JL08]
MPERKPPHTASIAHAALGEKLSAPAALRNADALCDVIGIYAPKDGRALEIASGTGQHVLRFAAVRPDLVWQPTDIADDRLASINAYIAEAQVSNVRRAQRLDATHPGWAAEHAGSSLILLINLLHLISHAETEILIRESAKALAAQGLFFVYGPFTRAGEFTSQGDLSFHDSLVSQDPDIGYKDDFDVIDLAQSAGLDLRAAIEMPANNLALIFVRPA